MNSTSLIRSFFFNIFLWLGTLIVCVWMLPLLLCPERWVRACFHCWMGLILKVLRRLVKLDYRVEGDMPSTPTLIAAKHQSAWETLALYYLIPNAVFVVKRELTWIPIVGLFFPKQRMIAVGRGKGHKSLKNFDNAVKDRLKEGYTVILFPEGTRADPHRPGIYRRGIGFLYEKLSVPVIPVALNSGLFWSRRAFTKYPGTITVRFLPAIVPGLTRERFMCTLADTLDANTEQLERFI